VVVVVVGQVEERVPDCCEGGGEDMGYRAGGGGEESEGAVKKLGNCAKKQGLLKLFDPTAAGTSGS